MLRTRSRPPRPPENLHAQGLDHAEPQRSNNSSNLASSDSAATLCFAVEVINKSGLDEQVAGLLEHAIDVLFRRLGRLDELLEQCFALVVGSGASSDTASGTSLASSARASSSAEARITWRRRR